MNDNATEQTRFYTLLDEIQRLHDRELELFYKGLNAELEPLVDRLGVRVARRLSKIEALPEEVPEEPKPLTMQEVWDNAVAAQTDEEAEEEEPEPVPDVAGRDVAYTHVELYDQQDIGADVGGGDDSMPKDEHFNPPHGLDPTPEPIKEGNGRKGLEKAEHELNQQLVQLDHVGEDPPRHARDAATDPGTGPAGRRVAGLKERAP